MQTLVDTVCLSSCCLVNVATGFSERKGRGGRWTGELKSSWHEAEPTLRTCPPSFPGTGSMMVPTLRFGLQVSNKGAGNVLYLNLAGVRVSVFKISRVNSRFVYFVSIAFRILSFKSSRSRLNK